MLSFIRGRLTVANGVLVIILVLAMSGGAYAASKVLITSIKEISPKVVKQLKGERGPTGERGAEGPEGKVGEKGALGPEGKAGQSVAIKEFMGKLASCAAGGVEFVVDGSKGFACDGAEGKQGPAGNEGPAGKVGESVVTKEQATGKLGPCAEGGAEFKVGSGTPTYACDGKEGKEGKPADATLEKGKTERGTFVMTMTAVTKKSHYEGLAQITYPVPLSGSTQPSQIEVLGEKQTSANCTTRGAEATAAEGVLCVYIANSLPETGEPGAPIYADEFDDDPYGCVLNFTATSQASYLTGEWALTAS